MKNTKDEFLSVCGFYELGIFHVKMVLRKNRLKIKSFSKTDFFREMTNVNFVWIFYTIRFDEKSQLKNKTFQISNRISFSTKIAHFDCKIN